MIQVTGGALQPLSQAVLLEAFPPEQRGKAMGFWGLGIVVALIFGPGAGGLATDSDSWRWASTAAGCVAALVMIMFVFDPAYIGSRCSRGLDRHRPPRPRHWSVTGLSRQGPGGLTGSPRA